MPQYTVSAGQKNDALAVLLTGQPEVELVSQEVKGCLVFSSITIGIYCVFKRDERMLSGGN